MNNTFCEDGTHHFGLWTINKNSNEGMRTCYECHYTETKPLTDEIIGEDKKQKEASIFLEAFTKVSLQDENIIGYVNLMLNDYINYMSIDQKKTLNKKIDELKRSTSIDLNNAETITTLQSNLFMKTDTELESFYDTLELFQEYNRSILNGLVQSEEPKIIK